jgi:hypothetical protein
MAVIKKKMQMGGKAKPAPTPKGKPMTGEIGAYNKLKGKDLELEKKTNLKFGDGPGSGPSGAMPKPKMKMGGSLKTVDKAKKPGLAKLPTAVRNKMGFKKNGGVMSKKK